VALYLIAIRTTSRVERLAVLAPSGAEALSKARAAKPLAPRDAFHVQRTGVGDVLDLPARGRPPSAQRVAEERMWHEVTRGVPTWDDIT